MHDEEQDYDYMPGSTIPLQERSDAAIDMMLTDALTAVKELSMERSKRIQINLAKQTARAVDMFTEYQESMADLNPLKLRSGDKL